MSVVQLGPDPREVVFGRKSILVGRVGQGWAQTPPRLQPSRRPYIPLPLLTE